MQSAAGLRTLMRIRRWLSALAIALMAEGISASAQSLPDFTAQNGPIPNFNAGPNGFSQMDFAQMYLDQINRNAQKSAKQKAQDQERIDSGLISALDLDAPNGAIEQYNRASTSMKAQNSKEAIKYLQKATHEYPKFVAAHIALGQAYLDQEDTSSARNEFETAAKLDAKFPGSFLNLGLLALSLNDFPTAESQLEKAASILPKDPKILCTLSFAQNANHQYQLALETAQRVHALNHQGMANVHYVAAAAAMAIQDFESMERELSFLISEDPTSAYAPVARQNLAALAHNESVRAQQAANPLQTAKLVSQRSQVDAYAERLKAQLSALGDESDSGDCPDCGPLAEAIPPATSGNAPSAVPPRPASRSAGVLTIRRSVDDVAVFFSVSSHGHMVSDLEESSIQIRDDNKPPTRVLQFSPQSKLPLRLALIIDTSGSVHDRFSFEKNAATKFVQKMLNGPGDLAFVEGFANEATITQDFTSDSGELGTGIQKLTNGGGTALFDAVTLACQKLAAYPDGERVARVLVILSDGDDNASHSSLKQTIQTAEKAGVTIYSISTREEPGDKTNADRILEALADRSGGEAMFPGDVLTLNKSFDKLHDLIRSRYFIAYKPADFLPNGKYRPITILAEKNGKRLQVRSRKGYHARLEAPPN